jgi:hypothetical protein
VMADLDILVPYPNRLAALEILRGIGFELKPFPYSLRDANRDALADRHHHFILRSSTQPWLILELHFHLLGALGRDLLSPADLTWFIEQSTPYLLDKQVILMPQPEVHLLYLCAHIALQHGLEEFDLRRYLDIHLLVSSEVLDWQIVVEHAVRLRWSYAVERVLKITRGLFDTVIPEGVLLQLRRQRSPDENIHLVHERESHWADWSRFWYILRQYSWRERLERIMEAALPPAKYMRHHYAIPRRSLIWPYYFRRWRDQLKALGSADRDKDILRES